MNWVDCDMSGFRRELPNLLTDVIDNRVHLVRTAMVALLSWRLTGMPREPIIKDYLQGQEIVDIAAIMPALPHLESNQLLDDFYRLDTTQFMIFFDFYVIKWAKTSMPSARNSEKFDVDKLLINFVGKHSKGIEMPPFDPAISIVYPGSTLGDDKDNLLFMLLKRSSSFSLSAEHEIIDQVYRLLSDDDDEGRELAHALVNTWVTARVLCWVRLLLKAGVSQREKKKLSASALAMGTQQATIATFLEEFAAETPSPLHNTYESVMERARYLLWKFRRHSESLPQERLLNAALQEGSLILLWALTTQPEPTESSAASAAAVASYPDDHNFVPATYNFNLTNPETGEHPMMTLMYHPDGRPRSDPRGIRWFTLVFLVKRDTDVAETLNLRTGRPENLLMKTINDGNLLAAAVLAFAREQATFGESSATESPLMCISDWEFLKLPMFTEAQLADSGFEYIGIYRKMVQTLLVQILITVLASGAEPDFICRLEDSSGASYTEPILSLCIRRRFWSGASILLKNGADPHVRIANTSALEYVLSARKQYAIDAPVKYNKERIKRAMYLDDMDELIADFLKVGVVPPPEEADTLSTRLFKMWNSVWKF